MSFMPPRSLTSLLSPNPFAGHALPSLDVNGHSDYYLRPIQSQDLPHWYAYLCLPDSLTHSSWQLHSVQDLQQFIHVQDWSQSSAQAKFAIAHKKTDELRGTIGFHTVSMANKTAEIAYDIHPDDWGKGIATTACRTLSSWAHTVVGFNRIQASVVDSNAASQRVVEKAGFQREGLLKAYRIVRGEPRDYWMFSSTSIPTQT